MNEIEFVEHLGVLQLQQGDVVVIKVGHAINDAQADRIKRMVKDIFPTNPVIILDGDCDMGIMRSAANET